MTVFDGRAVLRRRKVQDQSASVSAVSTMYRYDMAASLAPSNVTSTSSVPVKDGPSSVSPSRTGPERRRLDLTLVKGVRRLHDHVDFLLGHVDFEMLKKSPTRIAGPRCAPRGYAHVSSLVVLPQSMSLSSTCSLMRDSTSTKYLGSEAHGARSMLTDDFHAAMRSTL